MAGLHNPRRSSLIHGISPCAVTLREQTSDANTAGSMAATSAERILYAAKSRKWNSTQNNKFPVEFPTEHAANLEWIRKTEEEAARRRADEEERGMERQVEVERMLQHKQREGNKRKGDGRSGKWILVGVVGVIVALRAWQRYHEGTSV